MFLTLWQSLDFKKLISQCLVVGCLLLIVTCPSIWAARVINMPNVAKPFSASPWQNVLAGHVDADGYVDFERLKSQPKRLNLYMEQLRALSPQSHPDYFETPQDALAYWINAYNALSLKLIVDRYPIESVSEVPNLMQDKRYSFGGKAMSLEMIQDTIQDQFSAQAAWMPKALFALTIYSEDSPPILPQAFQGNTLKQQLETQAKRFLGNPQNLRITKGEYGLNPKSDCAVMRLSPWFAQVKEGISLTMANSRPNASTPMPIAKALFETVKPYLPPDDHALMMVRCSHGVGFLPPNPTLRKVNIDKPAAN